MQTQREFADTHIWTSTGCLEKDEKKGKKLRKAWHGLLASGKGVAISSPDKTLAGLFCPMGGKKKAVSHWEKNSKIPGRPTVAEARE